MADRCENCDKSTATQADYDTIPEGDGQHLCWRLWNRHDRCEEPTQDWRGRALAAEYALRALQLAYLDETHGDRDPATVTSDDIRGLREEFRAASATIRHVVNQTGVDHIDDVVPMVETMRLCDHGCVSARCTCFDSYRARKIP